jgi:putative membrane protein
MFDMMNQMMGGWGGGASWWLLWPLNLVFLGAVAVGVVWVIDRLRSHRGQEAGSARPESPLEILKRRSVLGELDRREFEEKRRDLLG